MVSSSYLFTTVLTLSIALSHVEAQQLYSFAEGKLHPEGLKHGAKGYQCLKEFHMDVDGHDLDLLKDIDTNGEEVTEEHLAAAIFVAYGEKGITNLCNFTQRWKEAPTRRLEPIANTNTERKTQSCSDGASVAYPSTSSTDPTGIYGGYISERIGKFLPDGAGANSRTSPAKMITEAQLQLDESLEAEYSAVLCETYFGAFTRLASIPDLVLFHQGQVLDGINSLTCGLGKSAALRNQASIRSLIDAGMKHDALINQAEMAASYQNSVAITNKLCSMSSNLAVMNSEIEMIKEKVAAP